MRCESGVKMCGVGNSGSVEKGLCKYEVRWYTLNVTALPHPLPDVQLFLQKNAIMYLLSFAKIWNVKFKIIY